MIKCQNCGFENAEGSKFCEECGTKLEIKNKCPNCGYLLSSNVKFCPECGFSFIGKTSSVVGDKNVIGGDVIGNQENYHVAGNMTILKSEDTTVKCDICNKTIEKKNTYLCGKCGKIVCPDCYDIKNKCCNDCTYKVGDKGPAGGVIFYDKGNYSDGWRFMEVSTKDLVNTEAPYFDDNDSGFIFGAVEDPKTRDWLYVNKTDEYSEKNCTKEGIGYGKYNTELLKKTFGTAIQMDVVDTSIDDEDPDWDGEYCTQIFFSNYAAKACSDYEQNGFNDWFLPSAEELHQVYLNLCKPGFVSFESGLYLSSSESPIQCGAVVVMPMDQEKKCDLEYDMVNCNEMVSVIPIRMF